MIKDGKFWIPLIALFSGMRMGEIVQLLTGDVKQEEGVWFFDVTRSESDNKKLKTDSSFRRVPIHRTLIELGILEFVKKAKPKGRLFPDIEPGADGYYSHNFSKWWSRYSRNVGFKAERTAFHSFRHTFIDGLRNARVIESAAHAIVGHSDSSVHASYGSGPSLAVLKEEIDKVSYPGLDLSFLYPKEHRIARPIDLVAPLGDAQRDKVDLTGVGCQLKSRKRPRPLTSPIQASNLKGKRRARPRKAATNLLKEQPHS